MKLQVTLLQGSVLSAHFEALPAGVNDAAEGRRLMLRGLRAGTFEQIISQAVRDSLADFSVVAVAPSTPGDGVESAEARAAVGIALGDYFDEGEKG